MKQTQDKTQRKHSARFFRFALVSSITGLVGLGSFALLVMLFVILSTLSVYGRGGVVAEFVFCIVQLRVFFLSQQEVHLPRPQRKTVG